MAPFERRHKGLLAGRTHAIAGAQQSEAVIESLGERAGAERAQPAGRQLECERQAVEAEADPCDVRGVLRVDREVRHGGDGAIPQQLNDLYCKSSSGARRWISAIASPTTPGDHLLPHAGARDWS